MITMYEDIGGLDLWISMVRIIHMNRVGLVFCTRLHVYTYIRKSCNYTLWNSGLFALFYSHHVKGSGVGALSYPAFRKPF
jgi:hypothetical protein